MRVAAQGPRCRSRFARRTAFAGAAFAAVATLALATPVGALAHGALIGKQDLPIPSWLFAWGASLVLIVSFVALSAAWRTPRYEEDSWRAGPRWLSRLLVNRATEVLAGLIGALLLVAVIYTGLAGTESPDRNFAVAFVFVTFWLGFVFVSILLGDVFRAFNPWRAIARFFAGLFQLVAGQSAPAPFRYPERLGRWPAAIGVLLFMWFELVYSIGFQSVGVTPRDVGIAASLYTVYTLTGMALFGIEKWLQRGEAFSVLFGMFARLAPLEVRDGELGRRRWLSGTTGWAGIPGSVALILIVIGGTAYDGASEGTLAPAREWLFEVLSGGAFGNVFAYRVTDTIFLLLVILTVTAIFWVGISGMHTVKSGLSTRELGRRFAHSFIPIAVAYLVAHYFSIFWFLEQAQFTYLLSDPLGEGADLFGTASGGIDYASLSANATWYVQVGALVFGHVAALVLGHDRALAVYGDTKSASRSQYWMLGLMVAFTCLGLFLLSQSNA